jgi:bifunctional non-homologous end joining protein LigD
LERCFARHSGKHNEQVQLCAFDVLAMNGDDLRPLALSMRKANLARLLARRPNGIFLSDFEQGEIGPDLFLAACRMGLEGLVSKRRDRPYQSGRSKHWIKMKNRKHPAMTRVVAARSPMAPPEFFFKGDPPARTPPGAKGVLADREA